MKAIKSYNTEAISIFHQRNVHSTEIVETPQDEHTGPPVPENDTPDLPESDLDISSCLVSSTPTSRLTWGRPLSGGIWLLLTLKLYGKSSVST